MRIAYLGSKGLPSKSGTERVVEALVSRMCNRHAITVYCDARYTPKGTKLEGIRLIRIPTIKGKHIQPVSLFVLSAIHAMFSRYDVIHLHGTDACFILPLIRLKYKVVATSHGAPGRIVRLKWSKTARFFIRAMEHPFIYLANYPTSVSEPDAEYLRTRYHRPVTYIPNGVNENACFDLPRAAARLGEAGLEPGNFLMFAAGRIDPSKGCHLVLEALNRMERPPKLLVVGDLHQVPAYTEQLKSMAQQGRVVFSAPIFDQPLLFGMIKQARLFIFPSISEGMSMMLLEAASLEVPVICSNIPENRFTMEDHVLYFRSEDAADLADKIQWGLAHPEEMSQLAASARRHVDENLTWDKIVGQYEEIYRACRQAQ